MIMIMMNFIVNLQSGGLEKGLSVLTITSRGTGYETFIEFASRRIFF